MTKATAIHFAVLMLLSAAALAQNAAPAAPAASGEESILNVHARQIELPATGYRMMPGDFDQYKGGYELSNGDTLMLYQRGKSIYATVGDSEPHEVVATARNVFVARDRELKVTLERSNSGGYSGELLMAVPGTSTQASGPQIRVFALR